MAHFNNVYIRFSPDTMRRIGWLVWRIFATNIPSECLFLRFPLFKKNLQHPVSSYKSRAALLPRLMQSHREFASVASY